MSSIIRFASLFSLVLLFVNCQVEPVQQELENSASNISKGLEECETAFAADKPETCFLYNGFKRWGWYLGPIPEKHKQEYEIYAGAAKCNTGKGEYVGKLSVTYVDGNLEVVYYADPEYLFFETHLYAGNDPFPTTKKGKPTVAPGQYGNQHELPGGETLDAYVITDLQGDIYIIAHAVVCPKKVF